MHSSAQEGCPPAPVQSFTHETAIFVKRLENNDCACFQEAFYKVVNLGLLSIPKDYLGYLRILKFFFGALVVWAKQLGRPPRGVAGCNKLSSTVRA